MKKIILTLILAGLAAICFAQRKQIDSLRARLSGKLDDTARITALLDLSLDYSLSAPDSNIILSQQAYELAGKGHLIQKQARALNNMAAAYSGLDEYPKAVQLYFRSLRISESLHDIPNIIRVYSNLGDTYMRQGDYRKALNYLLPANRQWSEYLPGKKLTDSRDIRLTSILLLNIGESYLGVGKIDSADYYLHLSDKYSHKFPDVLDNIEADYGEVEIARGNKINSLKHLREAIRLATSIDDPLMLNQAYLSEAKLYHNDKQQDSAEYYAGKALDIAHTGKLPLGILNAGKALYTYYDEDHNVPLAYKYFRMATAAKDSLFSQDRAKQLLNLDFEEKQRQQEIAVAQEQYRTTVRMYVLIVSLVVLLLLAFIFWRNSKQRQKANEQLQNQNTEIEKQKKNVENALSELKTTQNQLVQSAKMASLGELTAGIAHEIQNPLNFVNNFSDVSAELVDEMQAELKNGDKDEAIAISEDIRQNLEKIRHHGKRADFIVKGMLEHSRTSTGERHATNINALADEFLKLSYHGLRAKDKNFNTGLVTNFDENLPQISVVQQDIGRVLINLFSNAFYAVNQKAKTAGPDYKPVVELNTARQNGAIIISVKDNGSGIPENIREKIMQPFFTTKPTGEGTGLGLSLSYDIVVKGHGGTIGVETKEGEFTEFIVRLPLNS